MIFGFPHRTVEMKITIDLPDDLYRRIKAEAVLIRKRSSGCPMRQVRGSWSERVRRMLIAAGMLALVAPISGHPGHARDRMPGDIERVKMIGFTVVDLDRETEFFTKVLQFEKISDVRVVGTEFDELQGVCNANMRIVNLLIV